MTVNLLKCEFAKATVVYLGKVVKWLGKAKCSRSVQRSKR